ncbi:protein of unknown function [Streptomyces sp. KY75]|nr:protein of unknown function [Streptomyces sp. KY75]CAD5982168.1 protein of unknown function [Streptomyces sp. KY70]
MTREMWGGRFKRLPRTRQVRVKRIVSTSLAAVSSQTPRRATDSLYSNHGPFIRSTRF